MAFKRTNFKSLINSNRERFSTAYKFSKKANFDVGKDAYIIPLGLEAGFFETPCHRVLTHKIDGKVVGFNSSYPTYIKCKGIDDEGNRSESLCCTLAKMEKDRFPEKDDAGKRIISPLTYRVHIPVLILGNSLSDKNKGSYPVSKVSILNDLRSEEGLKFAFIEMASSSFKNDFLGAYGKKLKEDGIMDYELDENSEEFMEEVCRRLSKTVVKVHGYAKTGFSAALKEYSFFPFDNPSIASASPEGERDAIVSYKDNQEIQNKICEFLDLFNVEVDNMFNDWTEKDLQAYYTSAIGSSATAPQVAKKTAVQEEEEVVEVVAQEEPVKPNKSEKPVETNEPEEVIEDVKVAPAVSDEEMDELLKDPTKASKKSNETDDSLDDFEFDMDEDDFFED